MEEIEKVYRDTVNANLKELAKIIKEDIKIINPAVNSTMEKFVWAGYQNLVAKWFSGRKYLRTAFIKRVLPDYPMIIIPLSVSIDATVNLLDDLLDESLSKDEKGLYLIELIRALATFNNQKINAKTRAKIRNYLNKIISIATIEKIHQELMDNETDTRKIVEIGIETFDCRALDGDIYLELAVDTKYSFNKRDVELLLKKNRTFRALNLIKKDLGDIKHDMESNIGGTIVSLYKRGLIKEVVPQLQKHYLDINIGANNRQVEKILQNYDKMIQEENETISKLLYGL